MALHAAAIRIAQNEQNRSQEDAVTRAGQSKMRLTVIEDTSATARGQAQEQWQCSVARIV
jgi:type II secretory pathway component PulK